LLLCAALLLLPLLLVVRSPVTGVTVGLLLLLLPVLCR
jgi:hypothetical protein